MAGNIQDRKLELCLLLALSMRSRPRSQFTCPCRVNAGAKTCYLVLPIPRGSSNFAIGQKERHVRPGDCRWEGLQVFGCGVVARRSRICRGIRENVFNVGSDRPVTSSCCNGKHRIAALKSEQKGCDGESLMCRAATLAFKDRSCRVSSSSCKA